MSRDLDPAVKQAIYDNTAAGATIVETAKKLKVSPSTVHRHKAPQKIVNRARKKGKTSGRAVTVVQAVPVPVPAPNFQEGMVLLRQARNEGGSLKSRSFLLAMLALNSFEGGQS
jgi:DNA-binding CsgD family transcriptional regulator